MKLIKTYRKKNWWYQRSDLISLVCFAESLHAFDFLEALVIKATSWRIIYTCKLVHTQRGEIFNFRNFQTREFAVSL